MSRALKALDEHLRDQNNDRRDRIRAKDASASVAPVAPTPEEIAVEFEARRVIRPAWYRHVPCGRFCVRFRYEPDRWLQVHRSATAADLIRWMRDYLSDAAKDVKVWEDVTAC